jgi:hypothetical protein
MLAGILLIFSLERSYKLFGMILYQDGGLRNKYPADQPTNK